MASLGKRGIRDQTVEVHNILINLVNSRLGSGRSLCFNAWSELEIGRGGFPRNEKGVRSHIP